MHDGRMKHDANALQPGEAPSVAGVQVSADYLDDQRPRQGSWATSATPPGLDPRALLALQGSAGNAAVGRMLRRNALERRVQESRLARFVGHEHEAIGNVTGADVDLGNGVVLSWGQVVAIAGDEFGSIEELREAARTNPRRIRAALEHAEVKGPIPASLPATTPDDKKSQTFTWIELALRNVTHFAAGGTARDTWRSHHARALGKAAEAGLSGDAATLQEAYAIEAFGQHFLTDMFSGGHVRTPRQDIIEYYRAKAPPMVSAFVTNLRAQVEPAIVAQIMQQVSPLLRGNYAFRKAQREVHAAVDARIQEGLQAIGGQAGLAEYFALALAGAVSGALHDREGREGLVVSSEDHPEPWLAPGDALLDKSLVSRNQAELAVIAAREHLVQAHYIGQSEQSIEQRIPADPPATIHFAFDSSELDGAQPVAESAGAYLHVNQGTAVELVGHTDSIGGAAYNQQLGLRRANAVRSAAIAGGARPEQVVVTSAGESNPATTDPQGLSDNRRVDFHWQPETAWPPANETRADPARDRAVEAIRALGPPYADVERYVPRAVEKLNQPLPEWRWGSMDPVVVAELDTWVEDLVGPHVRTISEAVPETIEVEGYTVAPRQIVDTLLDHFIAHPATTLGSLIGTPAGQ